MDSLYRITLPSSPRAPKYVFFEVTLRKLEKIWLFLKTGSDVGGVADRQMMDHLYVGIRRTIPKKYFA